jgi:S1-C subfamily serine protease
VGDKHLHVTLSPNRFIHVVAEEPSGLEGDLVARLRRSDGTYEIEAVAGKPIWVNGRLIGSRRLEDHDMIEFCETGPISRLYLYRTGRPSQLSIANVLSDAAAYVRTSRLPLAKRIAIATGQVLRRLTRETTILFRLGVVIALAILAAVAYQQSRINSLLRQQIENGASQIEGFSRLLARAREEAITPSDLKTLGEELANRMVTTTERLSELERRSTATARVIAQSKSSIVFLQGAYGFRDTTTDRMLREVLGKDGKPVVLPNGVPLLSLEGEGPVAERQFTGTGFALGENGNLITNRHVAQPWRNDINVQVLNSQGLEPAFIRFIAYLPGRKEARDVELYRTSDKADLAILRFRLLDRPVLGLQLAEMPPEPGDEIIVMGYPTGLRSMLAQAGEGFVEKLQEETEINFWSVAMRLAAAGRIIPLASRGIVGRASEETIVYDAETTYGGSGGPVLDMNGHVVAINAAILPEYGGSNLGIPVDKLPSSHLA